MDSRHYKLLTAIPRGVIIGLELLIVLAVVVISLLVYGVYRLAQGPVDVEFARKYIQEALSSDKQGVQFDFDQAWLSWPDLSGSLRLELKKLSVQKDGQNLMAVQNLSLTLARAPLLIGKIRPERVILRAPLLTLNRDSDNRLNFVLMDTPEQDVTSRNKKTDLTRVFLPMLSGQKSGDFGIFSRIEEISIEQAKIRISDAQAGMTWRLNVVDLSFRAVDVGVYGSIDVQLPNNQQFSFLVTYRRESDELTVSSQFRDFALTTFAGRLLGIDFLRHQRIPLTGSFRMRGFVRDVVLEELDLIASADHGQFETQSLIGFDVPMTGARLQLKYNRQSAQWDMPEFAFNVSDVPVRASGGMTRGETGAYQGAIDFRVDLISLQKVRDLWPDTLRGVAVAEWLTNKLSANTILSDIDLRLPVWAGRKDRQLTLLAMKPKARFSFSELDADYRAPLFPVTQAKGTGVYDHDALTLSVEEGRIENLSLQKGTHIVLDDLTKAGAGTAKIHAVLSGPLSDILRYIALDPINLGDRLPVPPEKVSGEGAYIVDVAFPTVRDLLADQVDVDADARLNGVKLPALVRGQTLEGGPFDLHVGDGVVSLAGTGTIAERSIKLEWQQPITFSGQGPLMQVKAEIDSDEKLRRAFGADLDFIQGNVPARIVYEEQQNGIEKIDVDADLTPARLLLDSLRYEKPQGKKAQARLTMIIDHGTPVHAKNLEISGPDLKVENGRLEFGRVEKEINLVRADFPIATLGRTRGAVAYVRDDGRMKIKISGEKLDLAPYVTDSKKDQTTVPALFLEAQVDSLYVSDKESFKNATLEVSLNTRADLEQLRLGGTIGRGTATIDYIPNHQGKMTLLVRAADAGAFLRAFDVYENMVGGTLSITGSPIGSNNRDVKGSLLIKDFAVIKAPVLAQLLGSMSVEGVGEQLTDKGLVFTRLESGFAWLRRPNQDLMSFRDGRTSGSSLGLTFDGLYNRRAGLIEISGTIIPVSGLNTFASNIPLLGQLLTGGQGSALFAATYSIKGPSNKPQTFVNPLSVLTPGILRRLFFESTPQDPLEGASPSSSGTNPRLRNME